jgi:DNA repair exonuclease SbcCD nuclease subunit
MPVRFLHAADLHLGLRLTRFDPEAAGRIAEARFIALQNLAENAKSRRVDFTLIAGDVFDDNAVSRDVADRALSMFEGSSWGGPVYVIPGNHDPMIPGSVWDRDPWNREQPHKRVRLLRAAEPVDVPDHPCTLFPCPLRHRKSVDDPTAWIAAHARSDDSRIRIGLAHGSLNILPNLPEDDHLIPADAADRLDLDYLALGHWHKPLTHGKAVYPGTTEPMRFPDESATASTGWRPYSDDDAGDRFSDNGRGIAYLVEIDGPRAAPRLTPVEVGHLLWSAETFDLTGRRIGELFREFADRPEFGRTLVKLRLTGVVDPQCDKRVGELRNIVLNRYHAGSSFDASGLLIEPTEDQLRAAVGDGVMARVLDRLRDEAGSPDPAVRRTAAHALKLLYRLAFEDQPS